MGCGACSQAAGASLPATPAACGMRAACRKQHAACDTCPNGHRLQAQERPDCDHCVCDACGKEISIGESVWSCRRCNYDKCSQCATREQKGQGNGAPTLLTGDVKLVTGKYKNLLRTVLEEKNKTLVDNRILHDSNDNVGEFVNDVYVQAFSIIQEGSGLGESGECPFASAYEVHLFYQFCLNVCVAWSGHQTGKNEDKDKDFYSQMSDLCSILCFLDKDAVPLPEEIEQNIKKVQRDALYPHWVTGQKAKEEAAALECCINVGQKWGLQETAAFQDALAAFEKLNGQALPSTCN